MESWEANRLSVERITDGEWMNEEWIRGGDGLAETFFGVVINGPVNAARTGKLIMRIFTHIVAYQDNVMA